MPEIEYSNDKVEVFKAANDEFSWRRLNGENNDTVDGAEETFVNKAWADKSARKLNKDVRDENFVDLT